MKKIIHMIIVLGVVGLISGTSLVFVYKYATPLIYANQAKELDDAIFRIIPGGDKYDPIEEGEDIFKVYGKNGENMGYAFIAEGSGYQGNIKMIVGVKKDLETLYGIEILESVETPGLGGEIAEDFFKNQFKGLKTAPFIKCVKSAVTKKNEIQAITGATISSNSVTNILNAKIKRIRDILKQ